MVKGAKDEADAMKKLRESGENFKRPVVSVLWVACGQEKVRADRVQIVDWNNGRAGELERHCPTVFANVQSGWGGRVRDHEDDQATTKGNRQSVSSRLGRASVSERPWFFWYSAEDAFARLNETRIEETRMEECAIAMGAAHGTSPSALSLRNTVEDSSRHTLRSHKLNSIGFETVEHAM